MSVKDLLLPNYSVKTDLIATCSSTWETPLKASALRVEFVQLEKLCQYMPTIKDMPANPSK